MAILENVSTEAGDVLRIKTDAPVTFSHGRICNLISLSVGAQLYDSFSPYAPATITGWYWLEVREGSDYVVQVTSGVITSLISCP